MNNGVCLFNLRHPRIDEIFRLWREAIEFRLSRIEANQLDVGWDTLPSVQLSDQAMLHRTIRQLEDRELCKIYTGDEHNVFNYDGPFIKQILRKEGESLDDRIATLRAVIGLYAPTLLTVVEHTG